MKKQFLALTLVLSIALVAPVTFVSAHSGVEHTDAAEEAAHRAQMSALSQAQMEQMISLLTQLVKALTELKAIGGSLAMPAAVVSSAPVTTVPVAHTEDDALMEEHHDEHGVDATSTPVAKLVIEVETHGDKTHVHARYTDKPEDMFFVEASIDDENALVTAIASHTGLTTEVIRPALKYFR